MRPFRVPAAFLLLICFSLDAADPINTDKLIEEARWLHPQKHRTLTEEEVMALFNEFKSLPASSERRSQLGLTLLAFNRGLIFILGMNIALRKGLPPGDAEDIAAEILLEAYDRLPKFDRKRGKLTTFLTLIAWNIERDLIHSKPLVPGASRRLTERFATLELQIAQSTGAQPSTETILEEMRTLTPSSRRALRATVLPFQEEYYIPPETEDEFDPEEFPIEALLSCLDARENEIVRSRKMRGETLLSIGKRLNITKERVRQIYEHAMDKLVRSLESPYTYNSPSDIFAAIDSPTQSYVLSQMLSGTFNAEVTSQALRLPLAEIRMAQLAVLGKMGNMISRASPTCLRKLQIANNAFFENIGKTQ